MTMKFGPDLSYFLWSVAAGLIITLIYDVIRAFRTVFGAECLATNVQDFVFVVFSAIVMAVGGYKVNNGEFRVYSLVTVAGVFAIYNLLIGRRLVRLMVRVTEFLRNAIVFVLKVLTFPIRVPIKKFKERKIMKNLRKIQENTDI